MTSCPCLLQPEQSPFPQHPLLTGFVPQLCDLPLNLLQVLFLSLPNTGQPFPQSTVCVCSHTDQDVAGRLCCEDTLLAPCDPPNVPTKMFADIN